MVPRVEWQWGKQLRVGKAILSGTCIPWPPPQVHHCSGVSCRRSSASSSCTPVLIFMPDSRLTADLLLPRKFDRCIICYRSVTSTVPRMWLAVPRERQQRRAWAKDRQPPETVWFLQVYLQSRRLTQYNFSQFLATEITQQTDIRCPSTPSTTHRGKLFLLSHIYLG